MEEREEVEEGDEVRRGERKNGRGKRQTNVREGASVFDPANG